MGVACSTGKNGELKPKKLFRSFRSFGNKDKGEDSDDHSHSPEKEDSGDQKLSFSCPFLPLTPPRKSSHARKSSFLGKVGAAGLERAFEVLDVLGSGVTNLNSGPFTSGMNVRGNKISVLAFEVANTITKGATLLQSLSEDNIHHVKHNIFTSEGVRCLVSDDTNVLRSIAANDKREELDMFCREVIRFGDLCKDAQWHKLDRFFTKLKTINAARRPLREQADQNMRDLTVLAQHTAELYHDLTIMDRFQQDYRQKHEEVDSMNLPCQGESLMILHSELKHQKKLITSLKRKSLWSKRMEEVIEKLVEVAAFIHHQISESFGNIDAEEADKEPNKCKERLGDAGLALHYANTINQIFNIASRPSYLPPHTRDSLYHGLPTSVKNALPSNLKRSNSKEELSVAQIKAEMDKTLDWLVPMATSTSKMYKGFGWVGEWANSSGNDFHKKNDPTGNFVRLQTLYHADKQKADMHILELVKWLHHLINAAAKQREGCGAARSSKVKTTYQKGSPGGGGKLIKVELSREDIDLLEKVNKMQPLPIFNKSQRLSSLNRRSFKMRAACRSSGSSPCREVSGGEEDELVGEISKLEVLNRLDLAI